MPTTAGRQVAAAALVMAAALAASPAMAQQQASSASGPDAERLAPLIDGMAGRIMQNYAVNGMIVAELGRAARS